MDERLNAIRARADAATSGPWLWRGNVDTQSVYLASKTGPDVMRFVRAGMQRAKPVFNDPERRGLLTPDSYSIAIFQVAPMAMSRRDPRVYRGDVIGFRHPDAEFIASARADIDYLLEVIDQLTKDTADD